MRGRWLPSSAISPTGHYTGYTWVEAGLSDPALATRTGRVLHDSLRVPMAIAGRLHLPTLDGMLVGRHVVIDDLLDRAIREGRVGHVLEVASGLSPRGLTFARRYGADLTYIEADLADMAETKRRRLAGMDALGDHHRVVTVDALADHGPGSVASVVSRLDRGKGLAIITEGLVNYLPGDQVTTMWGRFADVLSGFAHGLYLGDIALDDINRDLLATVAVGLLSAFVGGRVEGHFADRSAARAALLGAGFTSAELHDIEGHPATGRLRPDPAMRRLKIMEATTS